MARCEVCDLELDDVERFCPGCGTSAPRRIADVSTTLRERFLGAADDDNDTEYAFGSKRVHSTTPPPPSNQRKRAPKPKKAVPPVTEPVVVAEHVREPETPDLAVDEEEPAPVDEEPAAAPQEEIPPPPAVLTPVPAEDVPVTPYVVLPARRAVAVAVREPEPVVADEEPEPEVARRGRWKVVLLLVVLTAGAAGAYLIAGRQRAPAGRPFTAQAQDRAISLDAPAGWRVESRGPGVLGIGEAAHDMHVHATAIRRSALDGLSLTRRAGQVHAEFLASLTDVDASRPLTTKIGPHPAIRQVLSTSSVAYVHSVVKMPKYFVNVLAWTSAERFDDAEQTLLDVVGSLQSSG